MIYSIFIKVITQFQQPCHYGHTIRIDRVVSIITIGVNIMFVSSKTFNEVKQNWINEKYNNQELKKEIQEHKSSIQNLHNKNIQLMSLKPPTESEKIKELEFTIKKLKLGYQESNFKLKSSNKRLLDEQNDLKERINHLIKGIKAQKDKNRYSNVSQLKNANNELKNANNELVKKLSLVEKKRDELENSLNQKRLSKEQQKQRESLRRSFRR